MAITYVGGKKVATGQSVNWSTSLTNLVGGSDSAPIEGDIVVAVYSAGASSDLAIGVVTAGYVELAELYANNNYDINLSVSWKRMGATPDTAIVFSNPGGTAYGLTVAVQVWRGADAGTPIDITSTTATGIGSGALNAPSITPTTVGSVVLVAGGMGHRQGAQTFTAPDLANFLTVGRDASQDSSVGLGSFAWISGSYDPSAWGFSIALDGVGGWAAVTMALRPAAAAATIDGTGAINTTVATSSATAKREITSSGNISIPSTNTTGAGSNSASVTGTGAISTAPVVSSANANRKITSSGSISTPTTVSNSFGAITRKATGAISTPTVTTTGAGTLVGSISGTGSATIAVITSTGVALRVITGGGNANISQTQTNIIAHRNVIGTGAVTIVIATTTGNDAVLSPSLVAYSGSGFTGVMVSGSRNREIISSGRSGALILSGRSGVAQEG